MKLSAFFKRKSVRERKIGGGQSVRSGRIDAVQSLTNIQIEIYCPCCLRLSRPPHCNIFCVKCACVKEAAKLFMLCLLRTIFYRKWSEQKILLKSRRVCQFFFCLFLFLLSCSLRVYIFETITTLKCMENNIVIIFIVRI